MESIRVFRTVAQAVSVKKQIRQVFVITQLVTEYLHGGFGEIVSRWAPS